MDTNPSYPTLLATEFDAAELTEALKKWEQQACGLAEAIADADAVVAEFGYGTLRDWKEELEAARTTCAAIREAQRLQAER